MADIDISADGDYLVAIFAEQVLFGYYLSMHNSIEID